MKRSFIISLIVFLFRCVTLSAQSFTVDAAAGFRISVNKTTSNEPKSNNSIDQTNNYAPSEEASSSKKDVILTNDKGLRVETDNKSGVSVGVKNKRSDPDTSDGKEYFNKRYEYRSGKGYKDDIDLSFSLDGELKIGSFEYDSKTGRYRQRMDFYDYYLKDGYIYILEDYKGKKRLKEMIKYSDTEIEYKNKTLKLRNI